MSSATKARIAILASGGGSNADKICAYFKDHPQIEISLIIANRKAAGVFQIAEKNGIKSLYFPKATWEEPHHLIDTLAAHNITHIVLAGFLLHIPEVMIQHFPHRIINIHPSLLPNFGGHGMYGHYVHEAVKAAGHLVSGMTIHEVNEHYDEGKILFQEEVELDAEDTPEQIAAKVLRAEHTYYSPVIEKWIMDSMTDEA